MEPRDSTKILATIGPATDSIEGMRALLRAGADAFRVNFSHGDGASLGPVIARAREAAKLEGRAIPIVADIQGPKLRIGEMPRGGAVLVEGKRFTLTQREIPGSELHVQVLYERLHEDVEPGAVVLLADGAIELEVEATDGSDVHCRVMTGGRLLSRKGLNLPGRKVSVETLTDKDRQDLAFLATTDVDIVAISFVRTAGDIARARSLLTSGSGAAQGKAAVMAKLERPEALENLDAILDASDGVMVARGDLAVELPFERVPLLQKHILASAAARGKWAVVATQMLASMVAARRPSRAEASDVVNAVLDGADAVMLSEETAVGENPALAVRAMDALTRSADREQRRGTGVALGDEKHTFAVGAAGAAVAAAEQLGAKAIVALAGSGPTALHVSKWRPGIPIVGLSAKPATLRRLNLLRGVYPLAFEGFLDPEQQLALADRYLIEKGWAAAGDTIVSVAALPHGARKETNTIRFHRVRAGT